jgi:NhaA family Na+:H+ antiporter
MKLTKQFTEFFESEKAGGLLLIGCTVASLFLANSPWSGEYMALWHASLGGVSAGFLINDGLMAIFFLMIGLELEREVYIGELSDLKNASLPMFAAIGGMVFPAAIYLLFNFGTPTQNGAGIPMATDIAFAVGIMSLLGNRVPASLKVFLIALAVIDDLGAILVIAIFYTASLSVTYLAVALAIFAVLLIINKRGVDNLIPYVIGGIAMWYFIHHSGIHATITGVLLAFAIPFRGGIDESPSTRLLHFLHKPVAFIVLPLFALSNTGIPLGGDILGPLRDSYGIGILGGLIIGKPLGIVLFALLAAKLKISSLPDDITWGSVTGAGFLAGIGFTMSIFITLLAFDDTSLINGAKLAVLVASLVAGVTGYFILKLRKVNAASHPTAPA